MSSPTGGSWKRHSGIWNAVRRPSSTAWKTRRVGFEHGSVIEPWPKITVAAPDTKSPHPAQLGDPRTLTTHEEKNSFPEKGTTP